MAVREAFLAPIAHSCARAGPQLLRLLPGLRGVARLLHAVALAAEPRLTAPVCERLCELADRCRPWRPALPQLTRLLRESLAEGGVPAGQAGRFSFELADVSAQEPRNGPRKGSSFSDAVDARAFESLVLRYAPPWPLQLVFTPALLSQQQRVFALLLRLRRAKWSLETVSVGAGAAGGRCAGSTPLTRLWWTLRSELLHAVHHILAYVTLAVIAAEWRSLLDGLPALSSVDAFAAACARLYERIASRCFLEPQHEAEMRAVDAILALALRLRAQLSDDLAALPAVAHAAAARRWRAELRRSVQLLMRTLRQQPEGRPLSEALDFNSHYGGSEEEA